MGSDYPIYRGGWEMDLYDLMKLKDLAQLCSVLLHCTWFTLMTFVFISMDEKNVYSL